MKKLSFLFRTAFLMLLFSSAVSAQEFDVQLTPSLYVGGYNISCHGANTGSINLFITGGVAPYTYVWNDGITTRNRSNLIAGDYSVTVTASNGASVVRAIGLVEPEPFNAALIPTEKNGGYHISENGGSDGEVKVEVSGGVPPYTYLWSNGSTSSDNITDVSAGTYSITVHDATNCTAFGSVTLIEPTVLHIVSITSPKVVGNYNIGCGIAGSINLQVSGGTNSYSFVWEHGPSTQNVTDVLEEGVYGVLVMDANGAEDRAYISMTRSPEISATATPFVYSNNKNTSCNTCNNGSINLSITSGTAPYTYTWNNGSHVQNPNNLAAGVYSVAIVDAAGCTTEKTAFIIAPEREDWSMSGNTGIDPTTQYIGTADNKDLVFKRFNSETMRFTSSGTKFSKLISAEAGIALNPSKTLKIISDSIAGEKTVYFGRVNANAPTCISPNLGGTNTKFLFEGFMTSLPSNPIGSTNSALIMGSAPWDGSGLIDVQGTDNNGGTNNGLLINYFCGRDVSICTNTDPGYNSGVVRVGKHFEIGGPYVPSGSPEVTANINSVANTGLKVLTTTPNGGLYPQKNTQLSVYDIRTKIISGTSFNGSWDQELFSIKGDGETRIGSDVTTTEPSLFIKPFFDGSILTTSYVGIGTDDPQEQLDVQGEVRISGLANGPNAYNLVQSDANGKLSYVSTNTLNGIGLWETNGVNVYRPSGRVGIGTSIPSTYLDVIAPMGEEGLRVETSSDPAYTAQLISSSTVTKLIGGFLKANNLNNEVFSINANGKTLFGDPNQPSIFIKPFLDNANNYSFGNVGIGNNAPNAQFQVGQGVGSISMGGFWSYGNEWITNYLGFNAARQKAANSEAGTWTFKDNSGNGASVIMGSLAGDLRFATIPGDNSGEVTTTDASVLQNVKMIITATGKVGIGKDIKIGGFSADYDLYVTHGIRTERVKVDIGATAGWADYVFDKNYKRMPLNELEAFIAKNKHLPDMPTECEAQENGVDLLEMQVKLLKSVEELTLHMIELKKENDLLKIEIEKLR
ncbi:MAG: hypothetical protein IPP32_12265 [Bacteroidetes bacterium]|nr:hypothetical protein [Bacteroidota bacterium]